MPPVFEGHTQEQLQEAACLGRASDLKLHKFMGNTQCVEREIKIQTEMSQQVKSPERREQESANLHWSINRMPGWMNSKKDYVNHLDDPKCEQQKASSRILTRSTAVKGKKKNWDRRQRLSDHLTKLAPPSPSNRGWFLNASYVACFVYSLPKRGITIVWKQHTKHATVGHAFRNHPLCPNLAECR